MPRLRSLRTSNPALRTALAHRQLIGLDRRRVAITTALSVLAGLVQAGLLLVIASAASDLTSGNGVISRALGPLGSLKFTVSTTLWIGAALVAALVVVETAVSWSQATLQARAQQRVRAHMHEVFSAADFDTQNTLARGDQAHILNGLTSDASMVSAQLSNGLVSLANFVTLALSAFVLSPLATVTVVSGLVVLLAALRPILRLGRRSGDDFARSARRLSSQVTQRLETALEIRAYGVDRHATDAVLGDVAAVADRVRRLRFVNRMSSVAYRIGILALVLVMLAVIIAVGASDFVTLTGALLMLLRSLSYGQGAQAAYQQINELLPAVKQLADEKSRLLVSTHRTNSTVTPDEFGPIVFDHVSFRYPDGDHSVLHDVSLRIEPGEFVAIVGPSGSGKSTLMSLLLRLRRPSGGTIRIGEHDLSAVAFPWWHDRVAYVPQESRLQTGTVADAIRFGRDLRDDDIHRAARLAQIADEIEHWPDGYDTQVGQLGDQLSGGQRQRVALARALAGRPTLLLLDEPTSALDPTSERLIADSLEAIRTETTIVAIAHRITTLESASSVVHMSDGRRVAATDEPRDQLERALSTPSAPSGVTDK